MSAAADKMAEKVRFEGWCVDNLNYGYDFSKSSEGDYTHDATETAWFAWEGRAEIAAKDLAAREAEKAQPAPEPCAHQWHHFGDQSQRRCNLCSAPEPAQQAAGFDPDGEQSRAAFREFDALFVSRWASAWQVWREAVKWAAGRADAQPADKMDAERLNWLDATNERFRMGWYVGQAPAGCLSIQSVIQLSEKLTPIRAAIDAAMLAARAATKHEACAECNMELPDGCCGLHATDLRCRVRNAVRPAAARAEKGDAA